MNNYWYIWENELTDVVIDRIVNLSQKFEKERTIIDGIGNTFIEKNTRTDKRSIDVHDPESKFLVDLLWQYATKANRDAFGFELSHIEEIKYNCFTNDMEIREDFNEDIDWVTPNAFHKKMTILVALSEDDEYVGGELELDERIEQPIGFGKKGSVLIFPSFLRYRFDEILGGFKKCLTVQVEGPKFR